MLAGVYNIPQLEKRIGNNCLLSFTMEEANCETEAPRFQFRTQNASPNKYYTIISRNIRGQEAILNEKGVAGADGLITVVKKGLQEITFLEARGICPGESFEMFLISQDRSEIAKQKFVPFPIKANNHGYGLSIEMADGTRQLFHFFASGFEPQEEVAFCSSSQGEVIMDKYQVDRLGEFEGLLAPAVSGFPGGSAKLEITGKKGTISLDYSWGKELKVVFEMPNITRS